MKTIHDDRYKSLIRQLVAEREARDITQTALSVALSRPQSYVAKVENLERRLDIVELADWLGALGTGGEEFMQRFGWW
ncbi:MULTISPECIES: helix-turn-helix domain-containing protein [Chromobacterium]|uniref:helix-turn-helix domain-containing protein n=1 Tax=Chromobacterium TaxID=535 RepID=UPI001B318F06|nr:MULTISPECIES: helix-turn-helix transcriptional regulator [Chromobacterium]MBP4047748.1 helix-turn-helix transcriptional regulator [Chromobacterium violaceum]MDE1712677.1 helix-turn-helix transcriptional regulator [Chromobacterium amazonense]